MTGIAKKVIKFPPREVSMALAAMVLVIGSFTVMAILDTSVSYERENPLEYDEETLFSGSYNFSIQDEGWKAGTFNFLTPSENGGMYMFDTTSIEGTKRVTYFGISPSERNWVLDAGKIVVTIPYTGLKEVFLNWHLPDGVGMFSQFTEVSPGTWEYEFSSAERLMMKNYVGGAVYVGMNWTTNFNFPSDGLIEFGIEFYDSPVSVFYATALMSVLGIVLIITAIFSTKWVNVRTIPDAISGIRRKRKGGNK